MPIYEYVCKQCHKPFEKLVRKQSEAIQCPGCGSNRSTLQFSVTAAPAKSGNGTTPSAGGCACTPATCGCH